MRGPLKVTEVDPYCLPPRTLYRAFSSVNSAVFKFIDLVSLADRCTKNEEPEIRFLARCIAAVAINLLEDCTSDHRWSNIVPRKLSWFQSALEPMRRTTRQLQGLRNLVQFSES